MKSYLSIYEAIQLKALDDRLSSSLAHFEKSIRRWYSKTYYTPLADVYKIPWVKLLEEYYESTIDEKTHNETLDLAISQYLPELKAEQEELDKKFDKKLLEEQKVGLKKRAEKLKKSQSLEKTLDKPKPITNMSLSFEGSDEEEPS